jgi:hypothetical protein
MKCSVKVIMKAEHRIPLKYVDIAPRVDIVNVGGPQIIRAIVVKKIIELNYN